MGEAARFFFKGIIMYNTYYLKNGICLVYEKMPLKSVSVGIWVRSGSMYETEEESGISHFIEHMLFKGTKNRTAKDIAEQMDFAGGHINAYTSRECTCYYTKTLSEHMALSIEILSDMYYNSLFKEEDIKLEKGVVTEEINMYEDSPEDKALDGVIEKMWAGNSLGRNIAGSEKSVSLMTRESILSYKESRYTPQNTVISVAGGFSEEELIALCEKYFCFGEEKEDRILTPPAFKSGRWEKTKDIEQAHLSICYNAFPLSDERIYSLSFLSNILGSSMSSRLFQSLREEKGLCYSIYSYTSSFPHAGMMGIYAGLNSEELSLAEEMIEKEIDNICKSYVSDYEMKRALSQIRCSIIMSSENPSSKMSANGKSQLLLGKVRTDDDILSKVQKVTPKDILRDANDIFKSGEKAVFILKGDVD